MVGKKMQENWSLKATNNLNQMLRVNEKVTHKVGFSQLLIVKHSYYASDDLMFPDPACLSFFTAFEENHINSFEDMELVAVDIFEGLMKYYIYTKDSKKSLYDCISFFKSNNNYKVEFEINQDKEWLTYKALTAL